MDLVESAFLADAQKLNEKRQAQMVKRVNKALPELYDAYEKGDKEEVEGILQSLKVPSSKEWYKLIDGLVVSAVKVGILRAHLDILRLKELYQFSEVDVKNEYGYDVVIPEEARDWLKKYGYEIGVITEDTVKQRLIKELEDCLDEGVSPREANARVQAVCGTWMSDFHAETIARTETAKMYNAGRLARWLDPENNGFVEALQYDAIVDTRTTDLCRHLDGKIIAVTNEARVAEMSPPNHFRCRATWLPVTRYESWTDDFPEDAEPEKGFTFTPPLPKLLQGKKEPLVQPAVPKVDPSKISDPFIIRSLTDEEFKQAIANITDPALKLAMILERAETMVVNETQLTEEVAKTAFVWWGLEAGTTAVFEMYGKDYEFHFTPDMKPDVEALVAEIVTAQKAGDFAKVLLLIEAFNKKFGEDPRFVDLISKFRTAVKRNNNQMKWNGLKEQPRSANAKKLLTVKRPPQTKNFKNAVGLQNAINEGEKWLLKYVDDKLAPQTGVQLKFQHDLDRAYAVGAQGTIHFGKWESDASVVAHEVGHVIHWQNKEIIDLVNAFFMKRTDHLTKPKSSLHGEGNIPDDFFNAYIGRIYGWEERVSKRYNVEGFYGQEVLSMGIQYMMKDPEKFYKDDKEHFLFTYAIMRGLF